MIGCVSNDILQKNNEKVASSGQEVETASEISRNTRSKQRSCSDKEILEKDLEKEYFVGNMLVTVFSQSSGSEVEEEDEGSKEEINSRKGSSERANKLPKKTEIKNRNGKRGQDDTRKYSTSRSSEDIESQQEAEMSALLISCMKRQLRVVIPRLKDNDLPVCRSSDEKEITKSPCKPALKDSVGNSDSVMRRRKFTDLSSTPTPEKHMTLSVNRP